MQQLHGFAGNDIFGTKFRIILCQYETSYAQNFAFIQNRLIFCCTKFSMNTKFKSEIFHYIRILIQVNFADNFAMPMNTKNCNFYTAVWMKTKLSNICLSCLERNRTCSEVWLCFAAKCKIYCEERVL